MSKLLEIRDDILRALSDQQSRRDQYDLDGWRNAERAVMLRETNAWRAKLGVPPVSMADIERAELRAFMQDDYSERFALYCAEIVLDIKKIWP